jgi:probable HAF family extracellular repeat protein
MIPRIAPFCFLTVLMILPLPGWGGEFYTRIRTGGQVWQAKDINEKGEMVGSLSTAYYFNGTETIFTLGLAATNLSYSGLFGINNRGLAVGMSTVGTKFPGKSRAFSYRTETGEIRDLGSLAGPGGESAAYAVNDEGIIVGYSATPDATNAVRFETNGSITDLGTLGGWWSAAADINAKGEIVGTSFNAQEERRAFIIPVNGRMTDLGTLGGKESWAARINNQGEVVGSSATADGEWHAFLYSDGKMIDLGTLGGGESAAYGINDDGTVVGWSRLTSIDWTAFIRHPDGEMRDLAKMVSVPAGDTLFRANAINNRGEIAASIFHPSSRTGVEFPALLKPGALSAEMKAGEMELRVSAPSGTEIRLEMSQDLREWEPLFTLSGEGERVHRDAMESDRQFYRIVGN